MKPCRCRLHTGPVQLAHNASEAARAVRDIASNIHGVSGSAKDATSGAQQVNAAATGMQQVSARLDRLVQQFRVKCETMGRSPLPSRWNRLRRRVVSLERMRRICR